MTTLKEAKELEKGCGYELYEIRETEIIKCGARVSKVGFLYCTKCKQKAKEILDNLGVIGCGREWTESACVKTEPDYCGDFNEENLCPECSEKQEIKQICERIVK